MGLFNFLKKPAVEPVTGPYKDEALNRIYHLLFCDDLALYKSGMKPPYPHPFDKLFSDAASPEVLQQIIDDPESEPRIRLLAYHRLLAAGHPPVKRELEAVIVEVGLDQGLDVLAVFKNATARYINQTGKLLVWETSDEHSEALSRTLFEKSQRVVDQMGDGRLPRRPYPKQGQARITFLLSDGLVFGEAPANSLFADPLAGPALGAAAQLMKYITEKVR